MIRLQNVRKTFRSARVLDGISLEVGLGERIALIPALADPKNLYSALTQPISRTADVDRIIAAAR